MLALGLRSGVNDPERPVTPAGDALVLRTVGRSLPLTTLRKASRGRATPGVALGVSSMSSLFGAICGSFVVVNAAQPLLKLVVSFGPSEYFALALLGLVVVSVVSSGSLVKGPTMSLFGIAISFVGIDPIIGVERYTFGVL